MRWSWLFLFIAWTCSSTPSDGAGFCMAELGCAAGLENASTARSMLNTAARKEVLKQRLVEVDPKPPNEEAPAHVKSHVELHVELPQDLIFNNITRDKVVFNNVTHDRVAVNNVTRDKVMSGAAFSMSEEADYEMAMHLQSMAHEDGWDMPSTGNPASKLLFGKAEQEVFQPPEPKLVNKVNKKGYIPGKSVQTYVHSGCRETVFAPDGECPSACPFFAEEPAQACFFQCVQASDCGTVNPDHRIADTEGSYCRACKVAGCSVCAAGTADKCSECNTGYRTTPDGTCLSKYDYVWKTLFITLGVAALFLLIWYLHVACSPITNAEGLQEALTFRSSLKLHVPRDQEAKVFDDQREYGEHRLWPLSTNLHREKVAGPGLKLHFNFHLFNICWACLIVVLWLVWVFYTDTRQLSIGMGVYHTPQELCSATLVGRQLYDDTLYWKAIFIGIVYLVTFWCCILYSVLQQYFYDISSDEMNMNDYAALCVGLPPLSGDKKWEERLQAAVEGAVQQRVVGVSICWDIGDDAEDVKELAERDTLELESQENNSDQPLSDRSVHGLDSRLRHGVHTILETENTQSPRYSGVSFAASSRTPDTARSEQTSPGRAPTSPERYIIASDTEGEGRPQGEWEEQIARLEYERQQMESRERRKSTPLGSVDHALMSFFGFGCEDETKERRTKEDIELMLADMVSTDCAYIVFESEAARDQAVVEMQKTGLAFQGGLLHLEKARAVEPNTVKWEAYSVTNCGFYTRLTLGFFIMILSVLLWFACFYFPYAYYYSMATYSAGEEPGFVEVLIFSLVVTIGNQVLYQICALIAEWVGFRSRDMEEACFCSLYFLAIVLQVILDLAVEGYIGWLAMLSMGTHTADGRALQDLDNFTDIFSAYPVQNVLGKRLFAYCFPGTFLLPFLLEPLAAIYIPYWICKALVRTHPEVRGRRAELSLQFFTPMDMGRYGDIMVNLMLVVLVFFLTSGQILKMFLVYIVSHLFLYVYDQYRILRAVPSFYYASNYMDLHMQALLSVPCAALAAGFVFKGNCLIPHMCFQNLGWACACVFVFHLLLHWFTLLIALRLAKRLHAHRTSNKSYSEAARQRPSNWFSSNPVHCLRSKHVFKHSPPCDFYIQGKEHLMRKNPSIGMHYEDKQKCTVENYDMSSFTLVPNLLLPPDQVTTAQKTTSRDSKP